MNSPNLFKHILFLLLVLSLTTAVWASPSGTLKGSVQDTKTGEPLIGVHVLVLGTAKGASTDINGEFRIYHLPVGTYSVEARMIGRQASRMEGVRVSANLSTTLNIQLTEESITGETVVVNAQRSMIQPDITASEHVIDYRVLRELPIVSVNEVIELQPGVTRDGHIRGGRSSEVNYLIDGSTVTYRVDSKKRIGIPFLAIQEISIQTGGFAAEYGNAMSGVVDIVSRSPGDTLEAIISWRDDRVAEWEKNNARIGSAMLSFPFSSKGKLFLAGEWSQTDTRFWQDLLPVFNSPIEQEINIFSKLDYTLSPGVLQGKVQLTYTQNAFKDYEYRWRYNLEGLPPKRFKAWQLSSTLNHLISERTYQEIRLSYNDYFDKINEGTAPENVDPLELYQYKLPHYYFITKGSKLWWLESNQRTLDLSWVMVSQMRTYHQLKLGFGFQQFSLSQDLIKWEPVLSFWGKPLVTEPALNFSSTYDYKPWQLNAFVQDKIDHDYYIANIGLRLDYFNPQAERPNVEWVPVTAEDHEQQVVDWIAATPKLQLSPRLGLSVRLGVNTWAYANYGEFFQMPVFNALYTGLDESNWEGTRFLVGDPDLKPERTTAYEFGVKIGITENLAFKATYFMKDIHDLIDTKTFLASDSKALDDGFTQYVNLPQGRSNGLELSLEKRMVDFISYRLNYSYLIAKGYSGSLDQGLNYLVWGFTPPAEEYFLSWDQRHTVNATVIIGNPDKLNCTTVWQYHSPRPYTYFPSRNGWLPEENSDLTPNNARMKDFSVVDFRINYKNLKYSLYTIDLFFETRNLLDKRNVLWIASDGTIGGELHDPAAWDVGRRYYVGAIIGL